MAGCPIGIGTALVGSPVAVQRTGRLIQVDESQFAGQLGRIADRGVGADRDGGLRVTCGDTDGSGGDVSKTVYITSVEANLTEAILYLVAHMFL